MEPLAAGFKGDQTLERVRQPEAPVRKYVLLLSLSFVFLGSVNSSVEWDSCEKSVDDLRKYFD
jgi:hypothetical protein